MAMCEQTGVVRSGRTPNEARDAIVSATETLIKAVIDNPKLEPSLTIGLPFRYKVIFNWTVAKILTHLLTRAAMNKLFYQTQSIKDFYPSLA